MRINSCTDKESDSSHLVRIFDVAEFSVHDGPGVRSVVYFQQCNTQCEWCHSPYSQTKDSPLLFNSNVCIKCKRCVFTCKHNVHSFSGNNHLIDRSKCTKCSVCIEQCPASYSGVRGSALHLPTVELTVRSLFNQLLPYIQLGEGKGGITLSGGEALLQTIAVKELIQYCNQHQIHVAVETSGLLPIELYESMIPFVDLWLFGIRVITDKMVNNNNIHISKVLCLLSGHSSVLPRIPMIPAYFDQNEVLQCIADLLIQNKISVVCLNPFNIHYELSYIQSGIPLRMVRPTTVEIQLCENKIRSFFLI